jgi:hypothetical protein
MKKKILFLHHSTGECILLGNTNRYIYKLTGKGIVQEYFEDYNSKNNSNYSFTSQIFPKKFPYGWKNYPFDYYNIWVKNAGHEKFMDEPTLEILCAEYDVIIFKHCFPVGRIQEDTGMPDINSEEKRLENYKLQYNALKEKLHSFPDTRFILWTPPASLKGQVTPAQALKTYEFYKWILEEWKDEGDNIYIWDFYKYETNGGLYLEESNAYGPGDSHPSRAFSARIAPLFCRFIIDVIESKTEDTVSKQETWLGDYSNV